MMDQAKYEELCAIGWRRELSPVEVALLQAWEAAHPECLEHRQLDQALSRALRQMADEPVASNFTARVLEAVARETKPTDASPASWVTEIVGTWRRWLVPAAASCLLVGICALGYRSYQQSQRTAMAASVRQVSQVMPLAGTPAVEVWRDFEAIRSLGSTGPDTELLALLK